MVAKNYSGEAQAVAERNGRMVMSLMRVQGVVNAAVAALGECPDAAAANRLLRKACGDVSAELGKYGKEARHA